ncbi:hypothetical protein AAFF_G00159880 [Aldrovandia affinis]|uniref:Uncharacterized protein n=1 Tax=Aldrovandia affinis TaxID=143900 RepID=A0AAD7W7K6_9TELE|nr:hypothetical protein AAFF_G00159880 [Aldrovandia affinis]
MAVAYRVVVSSLNHYSSVVIDRRTQHAVHYCTGPCELLTHGLDCTVDHRSACAQFLDATVIPMPVITGRPLAAHSLFGKFAALGNRGFLVSGAEVMMEECYQALQGISRARKSPNVQAFSSSLKDITEEAINLASGKVKEFSHERDRFSPGHSLLRKGRKVRPDSLLSRFFAGNEENPSHFGLPSSEDPLSPEPSTGEATAAFHLNRVAEEGLVARILEKAKTEGGAPGQDMRACLEILLCCSEDLRRCTNIIRQCCICRKSAGDTSDYGRTEIAYRSAMARLSGYLKKLPFWFGVEQGQYWRQEQGDLAELLRSLQQQQQSNLSSFVGDELPSRYEDVVLDEPTGKAEPTPNLLAPLSPAASPTSWAPRQGKVTATILLNHSNSLSFMSSTVLTMKKPPAITAPKERLCIEEKVDVADGGVGGEGMFSRAFVEVSKENVPKPGATNYLLRPVADEMQVPTSLEPMAWGRDSRDDSEEIDKLLMDFERLSRSIAKVKGLELRNGSQQASAPHQRPVCESGNWSPGGPPRPQSQMRQDPGQRASASCKEVDGALLQRILDSIESLAQELVESGAGGAGRARPLSRDGEVMRILRGTLTTPVEPVAGEGPDSDHTSGTGPLAVFDPVPTRDCSSTLLIQQTPEVIIRGAGPPGGVYDCMLPPHFEKSFVPAQSAQSAPQVRAGDSVGVGTLRVSVILHQSC